MNQRDDIHFMKDMMKRPNAQEALKGLKNQNNNQRKSIPDIADYRFKNLNQEKNLHKSENEDDMHFSPNNIAYNNAQQNGPSKQHGPGNMHMIQQNTHFEVYQVPYHPMPHPYHGNPHPAALKSQSYHSNEK